MSLIYSKKGPEHYEFKILHKSHCLQKESWKFCSLKKAFCSFLNYFFGTSTMVLKYKVSRKFCFSNMTQNIQLFSPVTQTKSCKLKFLANRNPKKDSKLLLAVKISSFYVYHIISDDHIYSSFNFSFSNWKNVFLSNAPSIFGHPVCTCSPSKPC